MEVCCSVVSMVVLIALLGTIIVRIIQGIARKLDTNAWAKTLVGLKLSQLIHQKSELELKRSVTLSGFLQMTQGQQYHVTSQLGDIDARLKILYKLIAEKGGLEASDVIGYEVEETKLRRVELDDFSATEDYVLIKRFSEMYGTDYVREEILQLQKLLESKGHQFELSELKAWIVFETKILTEIRTLEKARTQILATNPQTKKEIIKSYLEHYSPNDDAKLLALSLILEERNLFKGSAAELQAELDVVTGQIKSEELEEFEKNLLG